MSEKSKSAKAAEYRRQAASCIEVANRMSLAADRARMMDMAQGWLDLAKQAESKTEK